MVLPEYDTKATPPVVVARYVLGPVLLKGDIISTANPQVDSTTGAWSVQVNFTGSGGSKFDNVIAKGYYQKQVAIVLDNKVESAPTINAQTFNGTAVISGGGTNGFTHKEASNLSLVLRYGALPVQLTQSDVQTVSASLGKDSLRAGLIAGLFGLLLVLLYMILYYRALGIVVFCGLCVSGALLYSIVTYLGQSSLHQALSLAGVVGIIVSVGVTVDSYIVYFERLKDDIRTGRSVRASVDRSFSRAWRTIWTADLVSIIAAALLFWLTVGAVRGFAFFLGLSTFLDLVVAYFFTRPAVILLGRNRTFTEAPFWGVARGLAAPVPAAPAGGRPVPTVGGVS
ncbi:MAG: protein translocase subunit SecD [Acidimicrobiales bacterium]